MAGNKEGGIIAKYIIGKRPLIYLNENAHKYAIRTSVSETVYHQIMDEGTLCGVTIYRDTIDMFVTQILSMGKQQNFISVDGLAYDNEILAGERIRINSTMGEYVDLLKIERRVYVCTEGRLAGKIVQLRDDKIDISHEAPGFICASITLMPPSEMHINLDYKYLNIYRYKVAESISQLYDMVSQSYLNGSLIDDFGTILNCCEKLGQSTWTLRGLVDFMQIH